MVWGEPLTQGLVCVLANSGQRGAVFVARGFAHEEDDVRFRRNCRLSGKIQYGCNNPALDLLGGVHIRNTADQQVLRLTDGDIQPLGAEPAQVRVKTDQSL